MELESRRREIARSKRRRQRQLRRRTLAAGLLLAAAAGLFRIGSLRRPEAVLESSVAAESEWELSAEETADVIKSNRETGAAEEKPLESVSETEASELPLPARYDLREHGRAENVRDQGELGTCWAFASLNALESSMPEDLRKPLSAEHMALKNSFGLGISDGGDYAMSSAYLLSWQGPVAEASDPYGDRYSPDGLSPVCHVQEIQILPEKDLDAVKTAVFTYGGVQSSFYIPQEFAGDRTAYYSEETCAYYYNGNEEANHDIVIVGWDDEFSKENFVTEPSGDGAFLCMNTWGESFGENGFFYISYEDFQIGRNNVAYTLVEPADNYNSIYQTDLCGWTAQLGYGEPNAWFANIYTADEEEQIAAAGFYAAAVNTEYEIYMMRVEETAASDSVKLPDMSEHSTDVPETAECVLMASGNVKYSGYYTVPFEQNFPVGAGERFAVIMKIHSPGTTEPVAIEYCVGTRTANVDIDDGEGYISFSGETWQRAETEENCNVCLKAYGKRAE